MAYNIIVILGPTASGKTKLAARLAYELNTEVISADSRQVYKDMNIGTGKDYADYTINGVMIPYHLIDITEAGEQYHLHQYMLDFKKAYQQISHQNKMPVLCGGTGLYINAVLNGFEYASVPVNEALRDQIRHYTHPALLEYFHRLPVTSYTALADVSTHKRTIRAIEIIEYLLKEKHDAGEKEVMKPMIFGLNPGRELRRARIEQRLQQRLKEGLIDEVKTLLQKGVSKDQLIFYGLEYKYVVMFLNGELSYEGLQELLTIAIQQFAKRQMTYFRKMEKDGYMIHWIDASLPLEEQLLHVQNVLQKNEPVTHHQSS